MAKLFELFVPDHSPEILNLDQPLADKYDLRHIGNSSDPGIANQLRIESQQSDGFFRVAAGGGLPLQPAASARQCSDTIHVRYEVVLSGQSLAELDLQVAPRLPDANPIVLGKAIEQLHARLQHAVPAIPLGVVKTAVPVG